MTAESWLDILPLLPLARGVPVVLTLRLYRNRAAIIVGGHAATDRWSALVDMSPDAPIVSSAEARIDLADPQGFGYALRLLLQATAEERSHDLEFVAPEDPRHAYERAWRTGWRLSQDYAVLRGDTTDADHLALARALAEAFGG